MSLIVFGFFEHPRTDGTFFQHHYGALGKMGGYGTCSSRDLLRALEPWRGKYISQQVRGSKVDSTVLGR